MGTDGFECVEFCSPDSDRLEKDFTHLGFKPVAKHREKNIVLYRQGEINFLVNKETTGHAYEFAKAHGASACAIGFRVKNADDAYQKALAKGAESAAGSFDCPTIKGVGGSVLYFIDQYGSSSFYDDDFVLLGDSIESPGAGLTYIDHLTHNVHRGEMNNWAEFYERLFNFREIRFFDIKGKVTGLVSRAMTSPCGKIRIPINESADEQSQIEEFLHEFNGEGIQHIALGTDDIYQVVETLRGPTIQFLDVPDSYYETINDRVP